MQRVPVKSTNIASIGYDPETKTLEVEYVGSGIYHYLDVAPALHASLMSAHSKGQHIHKHIKGSHNYKRHL
jgi:hypothetical protein